MKTSSVLLLLLLAAITAFTVFNWNAFMAPAELSLGFTEFQAPLGGVMLGLIALIAVLAMTFVIYLQTSVLLEARRHAQDLRTHRELADKAEASRFTELRTFLESELARQGRLVAESKDALLTRMEQLENTLLANIGELEDRVDRSFPGQGPQTR